MDNLSDLPDDALDELLYYIYTGMTKNIDLHSSSLLGPSKLYQFPRLHKICVENLIESIRPMNTAQLLLLAEENNCSELKREVLTFCSFNHQMIIKVRATRKLGLFDFPFYCEDSAWMRIETEFPLLYTEATTWIASELCDGKETSKENN